MLSLNQNTSGGLEWPKSNNIDAPVVLRDIAKEAVKKSRRKPETPPVFFNEEYKTLMKSQENMDFQHPDSISLDVMTPEVRRTVNEIQEKMECFQTVVTDKGVTDLHERESIELMVSPNPLEVSTMVFQITFGIDVPKVNHHDVKEALINDRRIHAFNDRMIGRQPILSTGQFYNCVNFVLKLAGKNISVKIFSSTLHIAGGVRHMSDVVTIIYYARELIREVHRIKKPDDIDAYRYTAMDLKINNINTNFGLGLNGKMTLDLYEMYTHIMNKQSVFFSGLNSSHHFPPVLSNMAEREEGIKYTEYNPKMKYSGMKAHYFYDFGDIEYKGVITFFASGQIMINGTNPMLLADTYFKIINFFLIVFPSVSKPVPPPPERKKRGRGPAKRNPDDGDEDGEGRGLLARLLDECFDEESGI